LFIGSGSQAIVSRFSYHGINNPLLGCLLIAGKICYYANEQTFETGAMREEQVKSPLAAVHENSKLDFERPKILSE